MNAPRIPTVDDVEKAMGLTVRGEERPVSEFMAPAERTLMPRLIMVDRSDADGPPEERVETAVAGTIEKVGRMSGEAVMVQYEHAAKEIEALGEVLKALIAKLEEVLKQCDEDMILIAETAATIRDKGNAHRAQIEHTVALSNNIRTVCREFREKVAQ